MPKVFISHQKTDSSLAERVAHRIKYNGFDTYLDTLDDALVRDGPELANHLLRKLATCDQLIAVVSTETRNSWWVPWEIGVGSEKGLRMATYSYDFIDLPSYLKTWPALHSEQDIDTYCSLSRTSSHTASQRILNESTRAINIHQEEAIKFHRSLRAALHRR